MIVVDVSLPSAAIPPGPALVTTDTSVTFCRRIPVDGGEQYFRVTGSADLDAFERAARADSAVTRLVALDRGSQPLYRIAWHDPPPCPALYRSDLLIERMEGTPDGWSFRLCAHDDEALRSLQADCRERGRPFDVRRLDRSADDHDEADPYGLTPKQRVVLVAAAEAGFFAIPRETTLAALAAALGISDQAVSELLRRAQWNLLQATVLADSPAAPWRDG